MGIYDEMIKDRYWKAALEMLDDMVKAAEKAHPTLPDNMREIIESGLGRVPSWYHMYYLDESTLNEIYYRHLKRYRSKDMAKALGEAVLFFSPTTVKKRMFEWKKKLKGFESLEEIVEEFGVRG